MAVQDRVHSRKTACGPSVNWKQFAFSEIEKRQIDQLGRRIHILAKATVFLEGEPASALYRLTQGVAVLYKLTAGGRKQIVAFALPGDFLNSPFVDRHTCSIDVIGQATAYQFQRRRFLNFLEAKPISLWHMLELTSQQIEAAHENMLLIGRGTAEEKLVEFIINWRTRLGREGALANLVPLPMSRRDLANYLGLTIETVSRVLAKLEREYVIRVVPEGLQLMGSTERPLLFDRSCNHSNRDYGMRAIIGLNAQPRN